MFTTSYFLADADPQTRPVCFVFNGGPGSRRRSGCIWARSGRSASSIREDGTMPPPPYTVIDNPEIVVRALRPGVHRPAAHRLLDHRVSEEARKKMLSRRRRRRRAGRVHPRLARPPQALELADLSGRRKLRHDARRGARRQAAEQRRRAVGPDPRLVRDGPAERSSSRRATTCRMRCSCPASHAPRSTTASWRDRSRESPAGRARGGRAFVAEEYLAALHAGRGCRRQRASAS